MPRFLLLPIGVSLFDAPINSFWNRVRDCWHLEDGVNYKQLLKFNAKQTSEDVRKDSSRMKSVHELLESPNITTKHEMNEYKFKNNFTFFFCAKFSLELKSFLLSFVESDWENTS